MTKSFENLKEFTIHNGKLIDPNYKYDLHIFHKDRILDCYLLIPGLAKETMLITIQPSSFKLKCDINKLYHQIFKSKTLELTVNLPELVKKDILSVRYNHGILHIELVPVLKSEDH